MTIKLTGIEYVINEGETTGVVVKYQQFQGSNQFNVSVIVEQNHLPEGEVLDDLVRKDFDALAREIMISWIKQK